LRCIARHQAVEMLHEMHCFCDSVISSTPFKFLPSLLRFVALQCTSFYLHTGNWQGWGFREHFPSNILHLLPGFFLVLWRNCILLETPRSLFFAEKFAHSEYQDENEWNAK
jgi:hypothetical protein